MGRAKLLFHADGNWHENYTLTIIYRQFDVIISLQKSFHLPILVLLYTKNSFSHFIPQ